MNRDEAERALLDVDEAEARLKRNVQEQEAIVGLLVLGAVGVVGAALQAAHLLTGWRFVPLFVVYLGVLIYLARRSPQMANQVNNAGGTVTMLLRMIIPMSLISSALVTGVVLANQGQSKPTIMIDFFVPQCLAYNAAIAFASANEVSERLTSRALFWAAMAAFVTFASLPTQLARSSPATSEQYPDASIG